MELPLLILLLLSYPPVELATFAMLAGMGSLSFHELSGTRRLLFSLGLVVLPTGMLMLANGAFNYPWPEADVLGLWCVAALSLLVAISHPRWLYRSKVNLLLIAALAMICLWYTLWTWLREFSLLAVVPLAACLNLTLLAVHVCRRGELTRIGNPFVKLLSYGKELTVTARRLLAIVLIFACVAAAWTILGTTIDYRTAQLDRSLSKEVTALWGPEEIVQYPPCVVSGADGLGGAGSVAEPLRSDVDVRLEHHNRYKGLLWFSTFAAHFSGTYAVRAPAAKPGEAVDNWFLLPLPSGVNSFENLAVTLDGASLEPEYSTSMAYVLRVKVLADDCEHSVTVAYAARGRSRWQYSSNWQDLKTHGRLKNFTLTAHTNFTDIDYPKGSVSPTTPATETDGGMTALWHYDSLLADQRMGIEMPARTNAGPIAARMSFFAPVSLFFFCTALFTVVVLKKIPLHPMHYLFVSAGFFAFHILMAYLVDIISIHAAFWICAAVSTGLVVSYMRLVAGVKFAVLYVGFAQLVYLVGFSYAFFWVGKTGLTVTIGAIVTLFVLMQATGRLDWSQVFRSPTVPTLPPPKTSEPEVSVQT